MVLVLLFGAGLVRPIAAASELKIVFARAGIVLATCSSPSVRGARTAPADAAAGRRPENWPRWRSARNADVPRVTLPNIVGALPAILCSARAMGEFGAVSVVSGHIRGMTNTLPLHIEILYNDLDGTAGSRRRRCSRPRAGHRPRPGGPTASPAMPLRSRTEGIDRWPPRNPNPAAILGRRGRCGRRHPSGELVALLGPSGSARHLLPVIAGCCMPTAASARRASTRPNPAGAGSATVGFVFQHYALFRHMQRLENVAFGLRSWRGAPARSR